MNGNSSTELSFEKKIQEEFSNIKIFKSTYSIINLEELDNNERYLAFAGIGNFDNFIDLLKVNNINLVKTINYPDHYNYLNSDVQKFANQIVITTEKDFTKLRNMDIENLFSLPIEFKIHNQEDLLAEIANRIAY